MDSIECRLLGIERSNRRWRLLVIAVCGIFVTRLLIGAVGPASFTTLTATRIEIVDRAGNQVGVLTGEDGWGNLILSSAINQSHIAMCASPRVDIQPGIDLANIDGKSAVSICGSNDGSGYIAVNSAAGKRRVAIRGHMPTTGPSTPESLAESAGIDLVDESQNPRTILGATSAGAYFVMFTHKADGAMAGITASDIGPSGISVRQAGGGSEVRWP